MTRNGPMTTLLVWCLTLIFIVGGASLTGSLVLCVGSDGHTDLEVALGFCCVEVETTHANADGDHSASLVDPCGDCSDIELDATPLTKQKRRLEPPQSAAMLETVQVGVPTVSAADSGPSRGAGSPHLDALSTVVLLT